MVNQVHVLQKICILHHGSSIRKINVAACGVGWSGELLVGNHLPVSSGEILPFLDVLDFSARNVVLFDALGFDVPVALLLPEQEPVTGHAMFQRQRCDFEVFVGVNQGRHLTVYRMNVDAKVGVMDKKLDLRFEDLFEIRWDIEVYVVGTFVKRHRRK